MSEADRKAHILLVDDRSDTLRALESVLADLDQHVVSAKSGPEALRCVLKQEFAVVLLDVNMPGMDGFETAQFIRKGGRSRRSPIIFMTAYTDEIHIARGYSLGAVDYVLTPIVPDVLKTKVSVFVDLFLKTQQVERQADSLRRRAAQLHQLTEASLAINAAPSVDQMLATVAETAHRLTDAHRSCVVVHLGSSEERVHKAVSQAPSAGVRAAGDVRPETHLACSELLDRRNAVRLTREQLEARWAGRLARDAAAPGGWLAARLVGSDGERMGVIEVWDERGGEFSADDEVILVQLSQVLAIAVENTLYAEAREANRMKDEFLASLSHELRTPLNAMLGWTRLLRDEELSENERAHGLEVIDRSVDAQLKLIEDLLDVSRITAGKVQLDLRTLALGPVVRAAADAMRPAAEAKKIRIVCDLGDSRDQVYGDVNRLQQVVSNLLSNAVKFTPEGGRISVALARIGSELEIRVSDSGRGIPADLIPHVFDRFRQADGTSTRAHGGLGVGLAIVRHLVEMHGGAVRAASPGEAGGATLTVRLPAAVVASDPDAAAEARPPSEEADRVPRRTAGALRGLGIVMVDDEPSALELMGRVLRSYDAKVTTAASVREALRVIEEGEPDVLVSDIAMPGEDGYSLIRRVRGRHGRRGARIPAIALTAHAREEDRRRALSAGFDAYLAKPVEPTELVMLVASLIGRGAAKPTRARRSRGS